MTLVDGRLTDLQMRKIESVWQYRRIELDKYRRYIIGKNPPILSQPVKPNPDNRVPVPFANKIIKTLQGYAYRPGYITYTTDNEYVNTLKDIFDSNDEELLTSELAFDAMGYGRGYEVLRIDPDLGIKQYRINPLEGIAIYDSTLARNLVAFINEVKTDDDEELRTIYYADYIQEYSKPVGGGGYVLMNEFEHPFGDVPAIEYRVSRDFEPVYVQLLPMMNEFDKIISSAYADERERFADAYLRLLDYLDDETNENGQSAIDMIRERRVFEGLGRNGETKSVHDAVDFLVKPSRGADAAEEADRIHGLIYEMGQVIDTYDADFRTASGIALMFRILPMEWLCASQDTYFDQGLQRRITMVGNALQSLGRTTPEEVTIQHHRNIPVDVQSVATSAGLLKGILSDETIIGLFPADIVPDKDEEMKRIAEEREQYTLGDTETEVQDGQSEQPGNGEGVAR